jgi:hypothetical protein
VAGAVDGATINEPYWSSRGSPNGEDWYEVDLGAPKRFDDVKLYFYRDRVSSSSPSADSLTEPAMYRIQYYNGSAWVDVRAQAKSPAIPRANYNHVQFPPVKAQRVRVMLTHQAGHRTGLKEFEVSNTGRPAPRVRNVAPYVLAKQDLSFRRPAQVRLTGVVKDDGLPGNTLDAIWSKVSGPGTAIFANPHDAATVATFTQPGDYVLQLTASDGAKTATSTVAVTATPIPAVINAAATATPSASYTSPWESVAAINDGIDPPSSNDGANRRWGTWPNQGEQWIQLDWASPVRVNSSDLYFFDDGGGVRVPASWRIQYWDGNAFQDVTHPNGYGVATNQYNRTTFDSVTTTRMRAVLQSGAASVGVLEWKLYAEQVSAIRPVHVPTLTGAVPTLPATVTKIYSDGTRLDSPVVWEPVTPDQVRTPATSFTRVGIVEGTPLAAEATVYVRLTGAVSITSIADENIDTPAGRAPMLPATVIATYNDGSRDSVSTAVTWAPIDPDQYARPGQFTVSGQVAGTSLRATATVTVH